jgi:hypothetical protein
MRDLQADFEWLFKSKNSRDLSDGFLISQGCKTRECYQDYAPEFNYGITFVESDIAGEWLERAMKAEKKLAEKIKINERFNPKTQIAIIWSIEDVQGLRPALSDEQAMKVLKDVENSHDAEHGVTWDIISDAVDNMFPKINVDGENYND